MTTLVLQCRECGTRDAFDTDEAAVTSDWVDLESHGTVDEKGIAWHDGTCPDCQDLDDVEVDVEHQESTITDSADVDIEGAVLDALSDNPEAVADYKYGDDRSGVMNFLVGQVEQRTGGRAAPRAVKGIIREQIENINLDPPDQDDEEDDETDADDDPQEIDVTVVDSDGWNPEEGHRVDIAQADLPRAAPRHEHETGTITATDVDAEVAVRAYKEQTPASPLEAILQDAFGRVKGKDEVRVYHTHSKNIDTTFHEVTFPSGAKGVYPEACLVPRPEVVLSGDREGA